MVKVEIDTGDRIFCKIQPKPGSSGVAGIYDMPNRENFSQLSGCD